MVARNAADGDAAATPGWLPVPIEQLDETLADITRRARRVMRALDVLEMQRAFGCCDGGNWINRPQRTELIH